MTDFALARQNMVDSQLRTNRITDAALVAAMGDIPREAFVPIARRPIAYIDAATPVGNGRALPPPLAAARLYQMAEVGPTDLVLLVGSASGYGAAVLGRLASAVVALECDAEMAATAEQTLADAQADNVVVTTGALADGWAKQAPYDAIVIDGAIEEVPQALFDQLSSTGRLVAPVIGPRGIVTAVLYRNTSNGVAADPVCDLNCPALPGFERAREFVF